MGKYFVKTFITTIVLHLIVPNLNVEYLFRIMVKDKNHFTNYGITMKNQIGVCFDVSIKSVESLSYFLNKMKLF